MTDPEQLLKEIEIKENDINNRCKELLALLKNIGGIREELIEKVQESVKEGLKARTPSRQELDAKKIIEATKKLQEMNRDYNNLYGTNSLEDNRETSDKFKQFSKERHCDDFRNKMQWVSDISGMIKLMYELYKNGKLNKKDSDKVWEYEICKIIDINDLNYEIGFLDVNHTWKIKRQRVNNKTDFINSSIWETDQEGMKYLSTKWSEWWKIPSSTEINSILETLNTKYSKDVNMVNEQDRIALFMLLNNCYWQFFLQDKIFKCFDGFRWYRDYDNDNSRIGQILVIKEKH